METSTRPSNRSAVLLPTAVAGVALLGAVIFRNVGLGWAVAGFSAGYSLSGSV
jgi:hypothetical protein